LYLEMRGCPVPGRTRAGDDRHPLAGLSRCSGRRPHCSTTASLAAGTESRVRPAVRAAWPVFPRSAGGLC